MPRFNGQHVPDLGTVSFEDAWKLACDRDPSLKKEDPADHEVLRKAFLGLAKIVNQLENEWS